MSLVGPRPFFPDDLADYERHHFQRLHVLPGITGLWQVSGRSSVVDLRKSFASIASTSKLVRTHGHQNSVSHAPRRVGAGRVLIEL